MTVTELIRHAGFDFRTAGGLVRIASYSDGSDRINDKNHKIMMFYLRQIIHFCELRRSIMVNNPEMRIRAQICSGVRRP